MGNKYDFLTENQVAELEDEALRRSVPLGELLKEATQEKINQLKLKRKIEAGAKQLNQGQYREYTEDSLSDLLNEIAHS